jgi:hypothetical protein
MIIDNVRLRIFESRESLEFSGGDVAALELAFYFPDFGSVTLQLSGAIYEVFIF